MRLIDTGTHLLIEIIDGSWKANAHYNGVCMRRGIDRCQNANNCRHFDIFERDKSHTQLS